MPAAYCAFFDENLSQIAFGNLIIAYHSPKRSRIITRYRTFVRLANTIVAI